MKRILIVDDEENVRYSFKKFFRDGQTTIAEAKNGNEAINLLKKGEFDLVLMDIEMPGLSGLEAIQHIKKMHPNLPVIIMTAFGTTERVIAAMKYGAFEYIEKPFDLDRLKEIVKEALSTKYLSANEAPPASETKNIESHNKIIGASTEMKEVFKMIGRVAASDVSVLISGESGTGKELVAKALHRFSDRSEKPFVAINCAAIPDNLLESELFGYEKGAFTDAGQSKAGKFEQADGGTLFLDEVADMSLTLQAKLLRVLQEGTFERLGSNKTIKSNVRIISASNKNLDEAIADGKFREDLYYRLKVITITIPPLRMRKDDIPLLASHFLNLYTKSLKRPPTILPEESIEILEKQHWPGNVRQLENLIKRAILFSKNNVITPEVLENELSSGSSEEIRLPRKALPILPENLDEYDGHLYKFVIEQTEKELIQRTLQHTKGNQSRASKLLGISRAMLYERIDKFGIEVQSGEEKDV
ncbi:MAG: sigma-54-dependent Fis family transcriptional regulator [Bacteroidales bacterium]|nr:sigma-54-dependent Fis family transcriptional regulator [Bacteroidales bacterium]